MKQYLDLCSHIMAYGVDRPDRTGTGTRGIFGYQMRFDLDKGFPLLTTKKINIDNIIYELLWFLKGSTDTKYLVENGVHIWDANADKDGNLGPVYGKQWRNWEYYDESWHSIDQIENVIEVIKKDPYGRRHIVSAWNVADIRNMRLPPCHMVFQFYVANGKLSCQMYQRSADTFLGVPYNIASYALLTMMIAQVCNLGIGELIITFGDVHIYNDHFDQIREQLSREPRSLPTMWINRRVTDIDGFLHRDFNLINYDPHPAIKGKMSV